MSAPLAVRLGFRPEMAAPPRAPGYVRWAPEVGHHEDTLVRATIEYLASFERASGSEGERRAARWIAEQLEALGYDAHVEQAPVHGTYWLPLAALSGIGASAGGVLLYALRRGGEARRGLRLGAALAGAAAAAGVADEVAPHGQRLRRFARRRRTANVVAYGGAAGASRTIVLAVHHDAARSALIFHPAIRRGFARRFPRLSARSKSTPPIMVFVLAGPALVTLGAATRSRAVAAAGTSLALSFFAGMLEMVFRPTVPGADDNLSGVATMLAVARRLAAQPALDTRLVMLSTGSEESFLEGMRAFAQRHFDELDRDRTVFICVDSVGSPELVLFEGEGMLRLSEYDPQLKELCSECARELGIPLRRGFALRNATDGLIPLAAGYRSIALASVDETNAPANYHWLSDTPENVVYESVHNAIALCTALVRRIAAGAAA